MNKQEWKEKATAQKDNELANLQQMRAQILKEKEMALENIDKKIEELTYHKEAIEKLK